MKKSNVKISQSRQLKKIVRESIVVMAVGMLLLIMTIGVNLKVVSTTIQERDTTAFTNMYRFASKSLTYNIQSFAATGEQRYYDAYMKEVKEEKNREKAIEGLKKLQIKDSEWKVINEVSSLSEGLIPLEEKAFELAKSGEYQQAQAQVFGKEYQEAVTQINNKSDIVIASIQSRMSNNINRMSLQSVIFEILLTISFLTITLEIFRIIKFSRKQLLNPILEVEKEIRELANGNLSHEFFMEEDESEVGRMVSSIFKMKKNLADMIGEISDTLNQMAQGNFKVQVEKEYVGDFSVIRESLDKIIQDMNQALNTIGMVSAQIDQGAEQLSSAAQDMADSSTTQASAVEEITASMGMLTESMQNNAKQSAESVKIAQSAGELLVKGNERMDQLEIAINEIGKCSEQISTIIETINDIASQTNLLALNAAIEAARAGEVGKGFAVVAEQVKNLANESAKAAGETTKLIQSTVNAVSVGISLAGDTKSNMKEVLESAVEATEKMQLVANLLDEGVAGISQVNTAINQVAEVVENNTAASQETAAVSVQQKSQVDSMTELVGRFKIKAV